jgi:MFS family permease
MDNQIRKFGLYGLLKNLRFFTPFLVVFFLEIGLSYTLIGILFAIREGIVYIFEIPSGVFADRFGKKNELVICFTMYIISFVLFFLSDGFLLLSLAMIFFGFGEALRSGTHKAMIIEYLEVNGIKSRKSKVYGFTRSYSNIGSTISSLVGILLLLYTPNIRYLFLAAILPYTLDLLLVLSYPSYLNQKQEHSFSFKAFLLENVRSIGYVFSNKKLLNNIIESSLFTAVFKIVKDYIQPIVLAVGVVVIVQSESMEMNEKIYLGLIYAFAEFISIFVSYNAYRLETHFSPKSILFITWFLAAFSILFIGIFDKNIIVIIFLFMLFYGYQNIRKPFMVEKIGNTSNINKQASVLSIESQITSLLIIVFAPLLGFISDLYGVANMFVFMGILMMIIGLLKQSILKSKNE